jgi:small-conductance mechanosensitive channel
VKSKWAKDLYDEDTVEAGLGCMEVYLATEVELALLATEVELALAAKEAEATEQRHSYEGAFALLQQARERIAALEAAYEKAYAEGESSVSADVEYLLSEWCDKADDDTRTWAEYILVMHERIAALEAALDTIRKGSFKSEWSLTAQQMSTIASHTLKIHSIPSGRPGDATDVSKSVAMWRALRGEEST